MCGIAGFCSFRDNYTENSETIQLMKKTLIAMRKTIDYRGKDEHDIYLRKYAGLCHARLSIRDLTNGKQPMTRKINGHEFTIVYNGEIYNTTELSADLKSKGYTFETTSDTEVILYLYIEYQTEFIKLLNGIFAIAIYDGARNRMILVRDRVGVKPLFYTLHDDTLIFGSEIKALFAHPYVQPIVDMNSFREIFGIGPARTPGCGVFRDIKEVKPGHYTIYTADGFTIHKYWDMEAKEHTDSYEYTVDKVHYLVKDAITRQMVSDVPVCSFLSGGIDSSIVTAIACQTFHNCSDFNTFSFDFKGNDKYFKSNTFQPERDNKYVDIMLEKYKTNHTYLECDEKDLAYLLEEATYAKDLPGMADVDASLLYFCNIVSKTNKVVLTGECADEIFGGYPWFYRPDLLETENFPWMQNLDARTSLLDYDFAEELDIDDYVYNTYAISVAKTPELDGETDSEKKRRKISYLNIKWFMQTLLDRMDRTSMHYGLEARVPFADHRIIEYLFNVPWKYKYQDNTEKSLLRNAFKSDLPDEILHRKKSPYPKTYSPEYEILLKKKLHDIIQTDNPINNFIDKKKVTQYLSEPLQYTKPWFGQLMAGPQLIAYLIQIAKWFNLYNPLIIV